MSKQILIPDPEIQRQARAIEFDALVAEMRELLANNLNPWIASNDCGSHWLVASFGEDHNNKPWYVTTDHVRASEHEGDAESDAKFCALAKRIMPELLERLTSPTPGAGR